MNYLVYVILLLVIGTTETSTVNSLKRKRRNAVADRRKIWHRKILPYEIKVQNNRLIEDTIKYFNNLTCVQWKRRSPEDGNLPYVIFKPDSLCWSQVGKDMDVDVHYVYLSDHCSNRPIILHEMYHAMGFYHEMQRYDRDKYIAIHWENILKGYEQNFEKLQRSEMDTLNFSYDVTSILQYGSYDYSVSPNKMTISRVDNDDVIKPFHSLSKTDIEKVKRMYDCRVDAQPGWSKWSNFGFCDRKCIKKRSRFCYSPNGNDICDNNVHGEHIQVEQVKCSVEECSVDGNWSPWGEWSSCSATVCGDGISERVRTCTDPKPLLNGRECSGKSKESQKCRNGACKKGKYDCEFDNDGYCLWENGPWTRHRSIEELGPKSDISFINGANVPFSVFPKVSGKCSKLGGYYMMLHNHKEGYMKLKIKDNSLRCLAFHTFQSNVSSLQIQLHNQNNTKETFDIRSNIQNQWLRGSISIRDELSQVVIKGALTDENSFVAVDDIFFKTTECNHSNVLENATDEINSTRQLKDKNNATTTVKTRVTTTNTATITQTTLSTSVSTRTTRESEITTKLIEKDYLPKFKQKLTSHGVSLLISFFLINLCLSLHLLVLS